MLTNYKYHESFPRSSEYELTVNGEPVTVCTMNAASFACFSFEGPIVVEVTVKPAFEKTVIRPLSRNISHERTGNVIKFTLDRPENLTFEPDSIKPLFIYASPIETDVPKPGANLVRYFEAGRIHEVGELIIENNETVYIEGGAVVRGCIAARGLDRVSIRGRGVLDVSMYPRVQQKGRNPRAVHFENCSNVTVEGIAIINSPTWTLVFRECRDVHVDRVREIEEGHGRDGIDIVSSQNVLIENCMLRNGDDCIVIKAFGENKPESGSGVDTVLVRNCVLLNVGAGNALEIGYELRTDTVKNITFRDCDILCVHGHGAALSIHVSDHAAVENVRYENINIEHYFTYLLEFKVLKSKWGRDLEPGRIRNVTLKNINVMNSEYNQGYSISIICGFDNEHLAENIVIEDLYFDGKKVLNADMMDLYTRNAKDVVIR